MNNNIFIKYDQISKYDDGYNVLSDRMHGGGVGGGLGGGLVREDKKKEDNMSISVNSNLFNNKTSDINYKLLNIHNMLYDSEYIPDISDTISINTYMNTQTGGGDHDIDSTSATNTSTFNYSSHKLPVLTSSSETQYNSSSSTSKKTLKRTYKLSS